MCATRRPTFGLAPAQFADAPAQAAYAPSPRLAARSQPCRTAVWLCRAGRRCAPTATRGGAAACATSRATFTACGWRTLSILCACGASTTTSRLASRRRTRVARRRLATSRRPMRCPSRTLSPPASARSARSCRLATMRAYFVHDVDFRRWLAVAHARGRRRRRGSSAPPRPADLPPATGVPESARLRQAVAG
jgi:hypothetical protein